MMLTEDKVDNLLAIKELDKYWQENDIGLFPHQVETVDKVINKMNGRAILADEVGLGKTIEAGMILKEYMVRGDVETCLILTPASLGFQWWQELTHKFQIDCFNNRKGKGWHYFNVIISSLDKAKREPHCNYIYDRGFDMVIVDEAHRLKNSKTQNWKFVNQIPTKYMLLLTATPIQNDLKELYNLVDLLKPDLFGTYSKFKDNYVKGKHKVQNLNDLQDDLSKVMIRNQREEIDLNYTDRKVKLISLNLSKKEEELYNGITNLVKEEYKRCINANKSIFHLLTLQREVCSSSFAVSQTLDKMAKSESYSSIQNRLKDLFELSRSITENQKMKIVEEILSKTEGKAIIFTEYRATQQYICYHLYRNGYKPVVFSGKLRDNQKEWAKRQFMKNGDVLVSTEAGGQGINLQFCNTIINYDLPWNPMKVEQRIGRVHRLGQDKDVLIYNLSTKNTIEEKIINLLDKKINLFKSVIGGLDLIVRDGVDKSFGSDILELLIESQDNEELEQNLEEYGEKVVH